MNTTPRIIRDDGTEYPVTGTLILGRSDQCDITLDSGKVSRQHARVLVTDDGLIVEDLGSSNGTRINGMTLTNPTALMHGDKIGIDDFELRVVLEAGGYAADDVTELAGPDDDATELVAAMAETPVPSKAVEDLPGSWVEGEKGEHTEFLGSAAPLDEFSIARHSELPHLILLDESGAARAVIELETEDSQDEQSWIIGREQGCDLVIDDPTVSTRHAQLVHDKGRWRMVNLVSSNGIIVSGEKRLTVYLGSGDTVQLGSSRLVFFDSSNARSAGVAARPSAKQTAEAAGPEKKRPMPLLLVMAVAALALVTVAYFLLGT